MLKQFIILCLVAILLPAMFYGQAGSNTKNFNHTITIVKGDLNKDKLPDSVIVLQDTADAEAPYRLQVFFKNVDPGYQLVIQNDSAIEAEFPNGKEAYLTGTRFSHISINAGVLTINTELLRGQYEHKFRYQNGYFALIGFMKVYSDGVGNMTTTDFNLSTGQLLEKKERYDTGKIISKTKKPVKLNPLPNLKDFKPFSTTFY